MSPSMDDLQRAGFEQHRDFREVQARIAALRAEVTRTRRGRILWPIVTRIADVIAWWQVDVRGKR